MQVVDMLNEIYIVFDTLSEKHNVYKVTKVTLKMHIIKKDMNQINEDNAF